MKILFIGHGFFPQFLGGASLIQMEMVSLLHKIGMNLVVYQGGHYKPFRRTRLRWTSEAGIEVANLENSPNRLGLRNPWSQLSNEQIEGLTVQVLRKVKPDIVHIHELTFHCATIIAAIKNFNIPVIKTIHNYLDICSERDLLFNGNERCLDYFSGKRCITCSHLIPLRPFVVFCSHVMSESPLFYLTRKAWHRILCMSTKLASRYPALSPILIMPRKKTNSRLASEHYVARRIGFVHHLNMLDAIHVYSRRSGQILVDHGVDRNLIGYFPISTSFLDSITPREIHSGRPPIVFGFRGGLAPLKGVHVLIEAFAGLDQREAQLLIYGTGDPSYSNRLRHLARGLNVRFCGPYRPADLARVNSGIDVGVLPSTCEEVFGLVGVEYLQSRIPILGSNIGGITDYVQHGANGFLFQPGDVGDLRRTMKLFVDRPELVRDLQFRIRPWVSTSHMLDSLTDLYYRIVRRTA